MLKVIEKKYNMAANENFQHGFDCHKKIACMLFFWLLTLNSYFLEFIFLFSYYSFEFPIFNI